MIVRIIYFLIYLLIVDIELMIQWLKIIKKFIKINQQKFLIFFH